MAEESYSNLLITEETEASYQTKLKNYSITALAEAGEDDIEQEGTSTMMVHLYMRISFMNW